MHNRAQPFPFRTQNLISTSYPARGPKAELPIETNSLFRHMKIHELGCLKLLKPYRPCHQLFSRYLSPPFDNFKLSSLLLLAPSQKHSAQVIRRVDVLFPFPFPHVPFNSTLTIYRHGVGNTHWHPLAPPLDLATTRGSPVILTPCQQGKENIFDSIPGPGPEQYIANTSPQGFLGLNTRQASSA